MGGFFHLRGRVTKMEGVLRSSGSSDEDGGFFHLRVRVTKMGGFFDLRGRVTKIKDRRPKIEDRRSKIEDRRSKIEDRRSKIEDRRSNIEDRRSKIDDRRSKIEDGGVLRSSEPEDRKWGDSTIFRVRKSYNPPYLRSSEPKIEEPPILHLRFSGPKIEEPPPIFDPRRRRMVEDRQKSPGGVKPLRRSSNS